ncbi:DUF1688-domain-containing protein [Massarina eburnea CBS 473.64]|uniref:DUF1688-domain-containing protein n=1 Tax=Massarina eburnea CBS 473.64 TaxID=1395130 RepID=A0A6A6SCN0_9PLEO|nr:DUF1688-domain-containing protein [Massarina eburnea CBS 473.64]
MVEMDPKVKYLLSLDAVRDRAKLVGEAAAAGKLSHFDVREEKLGEVADFVIGVIKRDFGPNKYSSIPPHGRWQHFETGGIPRINDLLHKWQHQGIDPNEVCRRLIDLFFVSVLLDAGAGDVWKYREEVKGKEERVYERSEGIAVASFYMFVEGSFVAGEGGAGEDGERPVVDGKGLASLKTETLAKYLQITETNPILGLESRAALLRGLGTSLLSQPEVFGAEGRPGNVVDYLLKTTTTPQTLSVRTFWDILQTLLIPVWPKDRTTINAHAIGDAWPLSTLKTLSPSSTDPSDHIQPFHKLTQWLAYSLMVPFQRILNLSWSDTDALTALPEYRNGGLFVDLGVLELRKEALERGVKAAEAKGSGATGLPVFAAGDDVVVEWRALTLVLVDRVYGIVGERLKAEGVVLSLAQLLEAGTWKAGREIAGKKRPETKSSPIIIESDGTVF